VPERLNYHHLFLFWTVAREGGIAAASRSLGLGQPTLSTQVRALEDFLGEPLFARVGRRLEITELGRVVERYADEIFGLGREMLGTLRDRPTGRPIGLAVGVPDALPKLVALRLLQPALRLETPVRLIVREDRLDRLFAALAVHDLDLVLADSPPGPDTAVRAFSHPLGSSEVALYADRTWARRLRPGFPRSLDGAPLILPAEGSTLRRQVDAWIERHGLSPRVVAEVDDSALMKSFARAGIGAVVAPVVVETDVKESYGLERVGRLAGIRERFFAITVERRIRHPIVLELTKAARKAG
jgi:LysR family transcriptional regulator, transcriptional activator of nhaA